ncbi:unnamed protein product [Clonostachys byssicola]|uniref:Xylanolytic transcriptional activator regulatory domain-containing protein n=1 Tax=Clonostachys byssicola TaxID=160290 RepID=A0A9N9XZG3_9HYPO|nr:unnamed protein product [Clonostachys byssicola]
MTGGPESSLPGTDNIDEDPGDSSTHAFLRRVSTHLSLVGKVHPREVTREQESLDDDAPDDSVLLLPERHQASEYVDCFFSHLNATYRYLPRAKMDRLVGQIYTNTAAAMKDDATLGLFLSVVSCGCVWMPSWKGHDLVVCRDRANLMLRTAAKKLRKASTKLPPTMVLLQARFAYCQALIACHKYDSAWLALGKTIRLSQIIGLGRRRIEQAPLDQFEWRGLFWSIFMADRYLAMFLGRPFGISAHDISIPLPEEPPLSLDSELGPEERTLVPGTVGHINILEIASRIMSTLYGARPLLAAEKESCVISFESELEAWLEKTPSFFHSDQMSDKGVFYSVSWLFKRQQRTIRSAYCFTKMLLYRSFLLDDLTNRSIGTPSSEQPQLSEYSHKCRSAAVAMAELAAEFSSDETYNPVFWGTSHSIFCAIAVLVVSFLLFDDRSQLEPIIENAMKAHMRLTMPNSPQRQRLLEVSKHTLGSPNALYVATHPPNDERVLDNALGNGTGAQQYANEIWRLADAPPMRRGPSQSIAPPASLSAVDLLNGPTTLSIADGQAISEMSLDTATADLESGLQMMFDIGFDKVTFGGDFSGLY